jgi:hypothetical protein
MAIGSREFCEARMDYDLDGIVSSLDELKLISTNNMLLVERISDTTKYQGTDLYTAKNWAKGVHGERVFRVAKAPDSVYFNPRNSKKSNLFKTEMEVQVGDTIFINQIESLNSWTYSFEGKIYHTIKYDNIVCAIRDDKIIPVNGFILVSPVKKTRKALLHEVEYMAMNEGIVEYIGKPNKDYIRNYFPGTNKRIKGRIWSDSGTEELEVGCTVLFDKKQNGNLAFTGGEKSASIFPLESLEHQTLDKRYFCVQRPKIVCIL